ncbi:hypothetical protein EBS80_00425 [bacterium]|nr:hypothetical protein [bacterium]
MLDPGDGTNWTAVALGNAERREEALKRRVAELEGTDEHQARRAAEGEAAVLREALRRARRTFDGIYVLVATLCFVLGAGIAVSTLFGEPIREVRVVHIVDVLFLCVTAAILGRLVFVLIAFNRGLTTAADRTPSKSSA